jgi:hypothetical protein
VLEEPARFTKFECAVRQYIIYRRLMKSLRLQRDLFLAVSQNAYLNFILKKPAVMEVITGEQISFLVFGTQTQEVVQWIK